MERGELEIPDSFSGMLDWLIHGACLGGLASAAPLSDIIAPSVSSLCDRVASLERQLATEGQKRKGRESQNLGRLSAADDRAQAASTSAETLLKRRFAREQEVALLWDQLSAAGPTSSVHAKSKLSSLREELTAASAMIGKVQEVVQTGRDQLE